MRRTPCELIIWKILPTIRKEIATAMTKKFGLTQRETAKKLGVTPAAVCQYLSHKRGCFNIKDEKVKDEIDSSAKKIIQYEEKILVVETCRLCRLIQEKGIIVKILEKEKE